MDLLDGLQSQLLAIDPNWYLVRRLARAQQTETDDRWVIIAATIDRLCSALQQSNLADAVPLLRQLLRTIGGLRMSSRLWSNIRQRSEASGIIGVVVDDHVELSARPWRSTWLEHSEDCDDLERRNITTHFLGDGVLNAMRPAWTHYQSEAQKAAVDAWLFAPSGSTLLVTLPTGSGKSLCTVLPAWIESRGGRINSGTSLVVVPTVALAMDQQNRAQSFFKGSAPTSRTGTSTVYDRQEIEARLRDGNLPILYTSPESLLGSRLHEVCLDAAQEGLITRLVIDEAHLIESWGAGFRPEFQLLATLRRRMLQNSQGNLKTLLLSATVSERSRDTLVQLFSEPKKLVTIQANRLRPEIGYWFNSAPTEHIRDQRVSEALRFLPRPLILYVTRPQQAIWWEKHLRADGYQRVATFTGETSGVQREAVLHAWMSNEIDIMIGTSAFGLGVDKADVRAIVHATLPENVDRFYQEVGRGGRDGFSATALLCTCPQDIDLAYSLSPKRITIEKAEPRWRAMLKTQNRVQSGDLRRINRDAIPVGKHRDAVEVDRDWNDHILLLLQRAGAIDVVEISLPASFSHASTPELLIRVNDSRLVDDLEYFHTILERAREHEKDSNQTDDLIEIIKDFSHLNADTCIANRLAEIYDDVQIACGGCAGCRQSSTDPYGGTNLDYQVRYPSDLTIQFDSAAEIASQLKSKLGAWRKLNVIWSGTRTVDSIGLLLELLPALAGLGFQQFIVPDDLFLSDHGVTLVRALAEQDKQETFLPHRVIPTSWIRQRGRTPLLPLSTVIVYPFEESTADSTFQAIRSAEMRGLKLPACISFVHSALRLPTIGKLFTEHADGLSEPFERFKDFLLRLVS